VVQLRGTTKLNATILSSNSTFPCSCSDQLTLEFCQTAQNSKHQATMGGVVVSAQVRSDRIACSNRRKAINQEGRFAKSPRKLESSIDERRFWLVRDLKPRDAKVNNERRIRCNKAPEVVQCRRNRRLSQSRRCRLHQAFRGRR